MKARQKRRGQSGFTLAETLLAVLILLLVSSIVAAGIPSAQKAYNDVVLGANAQVLLSTAATALRDELGTAWNVECKDNVLTYNSADTGAKSRIFLQDDMIMLQEYVSIAGFNDDEGEKSWLSADGRPLVSVKAATENLKVSYESVTYAGGVVTFTGLAVKGGKKKNEMAKLSTLTIRVISPVPTVAG